MRLPEGFSQEHWAKYGASIRKLANEVNLDELHHLGFWVDRPHPEAIQIPESGVWVSPVVNGTEVLNDPADTPDSLKQKTMHFCFAVDEIRPHLAGRHVTKEPFIGPLGPAAFVKIHGLIVEFLIPDASAWSNRETYQFR